MKIIITWLFIVLPVTGLSADLSVTDDVGQLVVLGERPGNIVSFSPHLTEILFSLGVGERIVATVDHSDFPEAAKKIPRLGSAFSISVESVVGFDPDLILAWSTGGGGRAVEQLKQIGYPVYLNEALKLQDIASTVRRIGVLVGEPERGLLLANKFRTELASLTKRYQQESAISVFFQISDEQLYTVNDEHLIGQALSICGAHNVYGEVAIPVPMVSLESLVAKNPDVILVSRPYEGFTTRWQAEWQRLGWGDRIRYINASLITRPSLRMLQGIKNSCNALRE